MGERPEQKIKFGGEGSKILGGGPMNIFGKGGHTPLFLENGGPFSKIPPFLEIQDVPTVHWSLRKTKVLNNSCNQFVYHFYHKSILVLEECLQKW